jgi:hypothetical protein
LSDEEAFDSDESDQARKQFKLTGKVLEAWQHKDTQKSECGKKCLKCVCGHATSKGMPAANYQQHCDGDRHRAYTAALDTLTAPKQVRPERIFSARFGFTKTPKPWAKQVRMRIHGLNEASIKPRKSILLRISDKLMGPDGNSMWKTPANLKYSKGKAADKASNIPVLYTLCTPRTLMLPKLPKQLLKTNFPAVLLLKNRATGCKQSASTKPSEEASDGAELPPTCSDTSQQPPSGTESEWDEADDADSIVGPKRRAQDNTLGSAKRLKPAQPTFIWRYGLKHHLQTVHGAHADTPEHNAMMVIYNGVSDNERKEGLAAL